MSPLALHLARELGIDQAWSGPCDHAPPHGTTEGGPVGGRTYGWPLPCLLNYCSAGPWVAAVAPPRSSHFFLGLA